MNKTSLFRKFAYIFFLVSFVSLSSCVVVNNPGNGHRKGWYKNSNNPHHPFSTNPGKARGQSNQKFKAPANQKSKGNPRGKSNKK